jgi:hypothetical protein
MFFIFILTNKNEIYYHKERELYFLAQGVQRKAKQNTTKYPESIQKRQASHA